MYASIPALLPRRVAVPIGLLAAVTMLAAGCSSSGGGTTPAGGSSAASGGSAPSSGTGTAAVIKLSNGHLIDGAGRTVYLWVADSGTTSTCTGGCASVWPPVTTASAPVAGSGAVGTDLGTTKRSDGSTQVTYHGHPLYYFASDTSSGQASGQGSNSFGAKWWELDAAGSAITTAAAPSGGSSSTGSPSSNNGGGGGYGY